MAIGTERKCLNVLLVVMTVNAILLTWRIPTLRVEQYPKRKGTANFTVFELRPWDAYSKTLQHVQNESSWNLSYTQNRVVPDQRVINDTLIAAVFSCNPYWVSLRRCFPRTFECPHTDKRITFIASIEDESAIKDVDVVIFAGSVNSSTWERAMAVRKAHQVWVYSTDESSRNSTQVRESMGGGGRGSARPLGFNGYKFDMSFTYYSKSEVVAPFGEYIPFKEGIIMKKGNITSNLQSKKMVAWISSHCNPNAWNRTTFVHDLARLIPIDMYGACGSKEHLPRGSSATALLQTYKFYIAFENSCCSEYITEKFWQALADFELVPIVVGTSKTDYERVAPPNSFIFADDFDSVRDLARYIRKVATNTTLYNQYHHWRLMGKAFLYKSVRVYPFSSTEGACALLNFLEENAWKGDQSLSMGIDPFGSEWLGSCGLCGKHDWMTAYRRHP
ncbi:alpha-(1,3)-fucosyltransferase C-like [Apostichopus japonicus]|uniref:alpha-(1,3)-fucosyltransferase C-like n=1 Tax=Stichopus japonicus TaxID=307972 RepID=UPI003AB5EDD3